MTQSDREPQPNIARDLVASHKDLGRSGWCSAQQANLQFQGKSVSFSISVPVTEPNLCGWRRNWLMVVQMTQIGRWPTHGNEVLLAPVQTNTVQCVACVIWVYRQLIPSSCCCRFPLAVIAVNGRKKTATASTDGAVKADWWLFSDGFPGHLMPVVLPVSQLPAVVFPLSVSSAVSSSSPR